MTVEAIQDAVELELMNSSRKDVAQKYIAYRNQRSVARKAKTRDMFLEIINIKSNDITRENANMNADCLVIIGYNVKGINCLCRKTEKTGAIPVNRPVCVFTIGLLLFFSKNINMFIVLFLTHWSLIGLSKTYYFNIPEDFLLASASVPALYLFFKEYFAVSRTVNIIPIRIIPSCHSQVAAL